MARTFGIPGSVQIKAAARLKNYCRALTCGHQQGLCRRRPSRVNPPLEACWPQCAHPLAYIPAMHAEQPPLTARVIIFCRTR